MTDSPLMIFLNERPRTVARGCTATVAVERFEPELAAALAAGRARLTDGRGLPVAADQELQGGAILRVLVSSRSPATGPDALA